MWLAVAWAHPGFPMAIPHDRSHFSILGCAPRPEACATVAPLSIPGQVFDPAPGSEERVVALTSVEDALSPYCAAQDALIRCVIALTAGKRRRPAGSARAAPLPRPPCTHGCSGLTPCQPLCVVCVFVLRRWWW